MVFHESAGLDRSAGQDLAKAARSWISKLEHGGLARRVLNLEQDICVWFNFKAFQQGVWVQRLLTRWEPLQLTKVRMETW